MSSTKILVSDVLEKWDLVVCYYLTAQSDIRPLAVLDQLSYHFL